MLFSQTSHLYIYIYILYIVYIHCVKANLRKIAIIIFYVRKRCKILRSIIFRQEQDVPLSNVYIEHAPY